MDDSWKNDPKLKGMDPEKLKFLTDFAQKLETSPKDQLIPALLTLNMDAGKKGIRFSDQETELLVSILSANMAPADRKKLDALRFFSQKLGKRT